jgi:hypothetical protein
MSGVHMSYYPALSLYHVIALLSVMNVKRILCVGMTTPCFRVVAVSAGDATEYARWRLIGPGRVYTKRFLFQMMPMWRDCAKILSDFSSDLIRWIRGSWR